MRFSIDCGSFDFIVLFVYAYIPGIMIFKNPLKSLSPFVYNLAVVSMKNTVDPGCGQKKEKSSFKLLGRVRHKGFISSGC